jgi:flagellar motor switch protein FliM
MLSAEEIAALVASGGEAPTETQRARRPRRVREIDFSRPSKFTQEQQRRIERAHESFCRAAATQFSAELRTQIELEVLNVAQATWATALADIPQASLLGIVKTEPLDTAVLLSAELGSVRRMLTKLLGGADSGGTPAEGLTEIETTLARRLYRMLLHNLSLTWQELLGLGLSLSAVETQPAGVQLMMPPSEPCLVVIVEVREPGNSSTLSIVVPHRSIQSALDQLPSSHSFGDVGDRDPADEEAVRHQVANVETEVRAEVAAIHMSLDEVLALRAGDVVRFGAPASLGVTLYADEVPVQRAMPGRSGTRRAVQVKERLEGLS